MYICNDSSSRLLRSAQGLVDSAGRLSHQAIFQTLPDSIQLQTHRLLYKHRDMKTYSSSDRWLQLTQSGTSVQRTHILLYSYEQSNRHILHIFL